MLSFEKWYKASSWFDSSLTHLSDSMENLRCCTTLQLKNCPICASLSMDLSYEQCSVDRITIKKRLLPRLFRNPKMVNSNYA